MANKHILILGGDLRQYYMAKFLIQKDFAISYFGNLFEKSEFHLHKIQSVEKLKIALREKIFDGVILPMPMGSQFVKGTDGLVENGQLAGWFEGQKRAVIFGGKFEAELAEAFQKNHIQVCDFLENEGIAIRNAQFTAEGAIIEAILLSDNCVRNENALIIGYGRCGRMLADLLHGMKANVTVAEPEEEKRALAISYGYKVDILKDLSSYQFVFQTAPVPNVLSDQLLSTCLKNDKNMETVILDITSIADSVDDEYALKHHILVRKCSGLPGKYTAKSAGKLLAEFVMDTLERKQEHRERKQREEGGKV